LFVSLYQAVKRSIASNLVVEEEGTVEDENEDVIMEQYESESELDSKADAIDQSESDIESEITQSQRSSTVQFSLIMNDAYKELRSRVPWTSL
jgi:hypothetical protein